jgi:hypothetical protein
VKRALGAMRVSTRAFEDGAARRLTVTEAVVVAV